MASKHQRDKDDESREIKHDKYDTTPMPKEYEDS